MITKLFKHRMMRFCLAVFLTISFSPLAHAMGSGSDLQENTPQKTEQLTLVNPDAQAHILQVETARTPQELEQGLMFRTSLPPDGGMLFVLPRQQQVGFWMKNTLIPLDMIFIRADSVVTRVHPMAQPNDLTTVNSGIPVVAVLEIPGGRAAELGIVPGSRVLSGALPTSNP